MPAKFRLLSVLLIATSICAHAQTAPDLTGDLDPYFDTRFGFPSLDLFTEVAAAGETGVYIGGSFKSVAKLRIQGLTRWDGKRFHNMGVTGPVAAIAAANGFVYAGGSFQVDAGGTIARGIACWDERKSTWSALGTGIGPRTEDRSSGSIRAIAAYGSEVHVAGNFASIDGVAAAGLARWNGSSWSPVVQRV
ncbi:MAG: hypothetical protein H7039_16245, partial [Bryobacteraceae bacterium]|nr:hypothetical protein [Bryobacteraceae bacterium]